MRSLLTPVCLIAFGLLAALPFRRVPDRPVREIQDADSLAETVTPLREAPLVTQDAPRERPISPVRLASAGQPPSNPYTPWLENGPASYQEVAVPLALPEDRGNIFSSGTGDSQALEHVRLPENLLAGEGRATKRSALPVAGPWELEQPIPTLETAPALTSVLEKTPPPRAAGIFSAASKSSVAKIVEPTPEEPAPALRKRLFIREPQR